MPNRVLRSPSSRPKAHSDEHDERDRHRPDLRGDGVGHRSGDVAVRRGAQRERQAAEADVGDERRCDRRELRVADERAVQQPDSDGAQEHHDEPEHPHRGGAAVEDEERSEDDEEAGERADRQIDAAEKQRECLTQRDEAERRAREHHGVDVVVRDVQVVVVPDVDPEREHHDRERDDRGVVALDETRDPRRAARAPCGLLGGVQGRADRSVHHPLLGHVVALERRDRLAA